MKKSTIYKPEVFQGTSHQKQYFEGWYFKCVDKEQKCVVVLIPGIAYEGEKAHSFIQVCIPDKNENHYFTFDKEAFGYRIDTLYIQIEKNIFTDKYIYIDLENEEIKLNGLVWFSKFIPVPVTKYAPGIMGPFGLLPFLECYHGIVSMDHGLKGYLQINDQQVFFNEGRGYAEKDWGISFPEAYVWMQCNHFQKETLSVMFSVARIPLWKYAFTGFLCAVAIKDHVRVFATYTGAKLEQLEVTKNKTTVVIIQGKEKIIMTIKVPEGYLLKAPIKGAMKREISESLHAQITLKIYHKDVLKVHQKSELCAYEMSGNMEVLKS